VLLLFFQGGHVEVLSGTGIIVHNLSQRSQLARIQGAHKGKVSGLCFTGTDRMLSCGVDRNVKLWDVGRGDSDPGPSVRQNECVVKYLSYIYEGLETP
jgi:WD40 repeat protein